jgi:hypothetical protein
MTACLHPQQKLDAVEAEDGQRSVPAAGVSETGFARWQEAALAEMKL